MLNSNEFSSVVHIILGNVYFTILMNALSLEWAASPANLLLQLISL